MPTAPSNSQPTIITRIKTRLDLWFEGINSAINLKLSPKVTPTANRTLYLIDPGADANLPSAYTSGGVRLNLGSGVSVAKGLLLVGNNSGNELVGLTNAGSGDNGKVLTLDSTVDGGVKWASGAGSGTVTSVGISGPSFISWAGSPVTTSGTLTGSLVNQVANTGFMGPTNGADAAPTFRALVNADIPTTLTGKTLGATTTLSAAPVASAAGTIDIGTDAAPFRDLYLSPNAGSNSHKITSVAIASDRVCTLPDADSNTVIPTTATSNQFLTNITAGGVQTKAQPSSSNLSDASNVALRNNGNSWSVAQIPSAFGTIDLGSTSFPFKDLYLATGGSPNYTRILSATLTAARTFTLPDANSNPVQPATAPSNQFATAISSAGVITFAQPSSSNLSDASNVALRNNGNSWSAAQVPNAAGTIDLGSGSLPFRNLYVGGAATNNTKLASTTLTAARTHTYPDADSNPVIPTTATSNQFLTHITSGGVQTKAQPAFSDLSGTASAAQGGTLVTTATKGDLIVGSGTGTRANLAVGKTDGHVLTIDAAEATGVKWAAAPGSGGGGSFTISTKTADFTASDGAQYYYRMTTNNQVVTLPASPADGSLRAFKMVTASKTATFNTDGSEVINLADGTSVGDGGLTLRSIDGVLQLTAVTGGWDES